jgi:hypothetical protein
MRGRFSGWPFSIAEALAVLGGGVFGTTLNDDLEDS